MMLAKLNTYHYDKAGKPLCGAEPAGAFVVESLTRTSCNACREILGTGPIVPFAKAPPLIGPKEYQDANFTLRGLRNLAQHLLTDPKEVGTPGCHLAGLFIALDAMALRGALPEEWKAKAK